jgi:hypothetical protein
MGWGLTKKSNLRQVVSMHGLEHLLRKLLMFICCKLKNLKTGWTEQWFWYSGNPPLE